MSSETSRAAGWRRRSLATLAGTAALLTMAASPALAARPQPGIGHAIPDGTAFAQHHPDQGALKQIGQLRGSHDATDANLISQMIGTPQADWFTGGSPHQVQQDVKQAVAAAAAKGTVPVLVAYDLPFRDCGQYSSGGALDTASYEAWIDGFARGIGNSNAVVILEPDGLGIIPFYQPLYGQMDWCQPTDADGNPQPGATPANRFEQLNYAVDALEARPNTAVYLDGTHSAWLGVGEAADRLLKAGVQRAQGFFLNVSNYETTSNNAQFGTWVSECIAFATDPEEGGWRIGHTAWCAGQYNSNGVADYSQAQIDSTNAWFAGSLGTATASTHFVIDTSRNGQGPWTPTAGKYTGDPQTWCNPPGAGLGLRPTTDTGNRLIDAYLWIKTPGESDGQCNRSVKGSTTDPEWGGITDPAAGAWFPQQALQLAQNAVPPLPTSKPHPAR